jgi:hypothetical protein
MYTIQNNPARRYNCDKKGILILQHKHTKILGLKEKCQISSLQSADRGPLVIVVTCLSPTGHFIFLYLYFQENMWNKNWWINHRLNQSTFAIPRVDTDQAFQPVISSFHQTYNADKIRFCYLSIGRALFTHKETGGHYLARESCWHYLPLISQQPQNAALVYSFHGTPENILLSRNWKMALLKPRASRHRLPYWRTIRQCVQASYNR